jgi:hypothetical protein
MPPSVRGEAMRARRGEHVATRAQMIEQDQFEHAGSSSQFAHGEGVTDWNQPDEPLQAWGVDPAGARPDQLHRCPISCATTRASSLASIDLTLVISITRLPNNLD